MKTRKKLKIQTLNDGSKSSPGDSCPCCGSRDGNFINVRVFKAKIKYYSGQQKPISFCDEDGDFIESFYNCKNNQKLFNYAPDFKGLLKRKVIFIDED